MLAEEIRKENKRLYEQGKLEGKLETARALLLKDLPLPLILEITRLPKEEIEKLQQAHLMPSLNNEDVFKQNNG